MEIRAVAPRLDAATIDRAVERGGLRRSGECMSGIPADASSVQFQARERGTGGFARVVALPDDVDPAHGNAGYRGGVLRLGGARRESDRPGRITLR